MKNKRIIWYIVIIAIIALIAWLIFFRSQDSNIETGEEATPTADVTCSDATEVAKKITNIWGNSTSIEDGTFLDEIMPYVTEGLFSGFREELASDETTDNYSITLESDQCENTEKGARVTIEGLLKQKDDSQGITVVVDLVNLEGSILADGFAENLK